MKTLNLGIVLDQGSDFNLIIGVFGTNGPIDITGYAFKGQMRPSTNSAVGGQAEGTITLNSNPAPGDIAAVNGVAIQFVASAPAANQVLIGASASATALALASFLSSSPAAGLVLMTYTVVGAVVTCTSVLAGTAGNSYTLATTSSGIALSGATLSGGAVIAPVAEFSFTLQNQTTNKGQVKMSLPSSTTAAIAASIATAISENRQVTPFVFDVKMLDTASVITRIIQGLVYVSPQATLETFP